MKASASSSVIPFGYSVADTAPFIADRPTTELIRDPRSRCGALVLFLWEQVQNHALGCSLRDSAPPHDMRISMCRWPSHRGNAIDTHRGDRAMHTNSDIRTLSIDEIDAVGGAYKGQPTFSAGRR